MQVQRNTLLTEYCNKLHFERYQKVCSKLRANAYLSRVSFKFRKNLYTYYFAILFRLLSQLIKFTRSYSYGH